MVRKLSATEPTGGARRLSNACCAAVAGAAMMGSFAGPASALTDVDPVQPERVWGGCVLHTAETGTVANPTSTVQELIDDMVTSGLSLTTGSPKVAFVVIYSLEDNDGQGPVSALTGSGTGFTGPIVCINPDAVRSIIEVKETDDIPAQTGPTGPFGADSIDIRDLEDAMVLRYELNSTNTDINGKIEKRFCHTTGNNNDCFRISPLSDPLLP